MFDGVFEGHFSSITDTRVADDPWGMGLKVEVLRADHDEWRRWREEHEGQSALVKVVGRTVTRAMIVQTVASAASAAQPGFRQKAKPTRAEQEAEGRDQEAKAMRGAEAAVDRALSAVPQDEMDALWKTDANSIKPGAASVLIKGWSGVNEPGGVPIECTLHNRLRFVGWEGVLIEPPTAEPTFLSMEQAARADYAPPVGSVVTKFGGNPRKPSGELWTCPEGMPYGPAPAGDAVTRWLMEESRKGALVRAQLLGDSADVLADTPGGSPATSAPSA